MSLSIENEIAKLEKDHQDFTAQQKQLELMFHQCTGSLSYIKAKIDELRKKQQEETSAQEPKSAPSDEEVA